MLCTTLNALGWRQGGARYIDKDKELDCRLADMQYLIGPPADVMCPQAVTAGAGVYFRSLVCVVMCRVGIDTIDWVPARRCGASSAPSALVRGPTWAVKTAKLIS